MSRLSVAALLLAVARVASASTAADVCPANADPCTVSSARTVDPGSVLDFGTRQLDVTSSGSITVPSGQLSFASIIRVVETAVASFPGGGASLQEILDADRWAREYVRSNMGSLTR